jgi:hypothetical protein
MGGDPGQVHPAPVDLEDEQHVQPDQPDGLDGQEVTGEDTSGLDAEELRPRWPAGARRRPEMVSAQDVPDRGGGDLYAGPSALADDGESAWGAVTGFLRFRFPRPLSEPVMWRST